MRFFMLTYDQSFHFSNSYFFEFRLSDNHGKREEKIVVTYPDQKDNEKV